MEFTGGIYIASKAKHGPRWLELRAAGVSIVSTWIDEWGEGQSVNRALLWARNISEASRAKALIVYHELGEVQKGALSEVGAALACRVPVFWVGPVEGYTVTEHDGVRICSSLERALYRASDALSRAVREESAVCLRKILEQNTSLCVLSKQHTYFSTRGHLLIWASGKTLEAGTTVLTVEYYCKWYSLQLVHSDGRVEELQYPDELTYCKAGESPYVDHVPNPVVVRRFAEAKGYHIDERAFEIMVGRWYLEAASGAETLHEG